MACWRNEEKKEKKMIREREARQGGASHTTDKEDRERTSNRLDNWSRSVHSPGPEIR